MSYVEALRDLVDPGERWRLVAGVVTQASPLLVQVPPTTVGTPATALAHYAPAAGDRVLLFVSSTARWVVGKVS